MLRSRGSYCCIAVGDKVRGTEPVTLNREVMKASTHRHPHVPTLDCGIVSQGKRCRPLESFRNGQDKALLGPTCTGREIDCTV